MPTTTLEQELRDCIKALKQVRDLTDSLPFNVPEVLEGMLNKHEQGLLNE